jgi:hypothetical protein
MISQENDELLEPLHASVDAQCFNDDGNSERASILPLDGVIAIASMPVVELDVKWSGGR